MGRTTVLMNIILAIVLFFGNGLIGKMKTKSGRIFGYDSFGFNKVDSANFAEHFFQKVVHPAIFVAIAAAILQYCNLNIIARDLWLVVPLYWVLRIAHIFVWNIACFINWKYEFTSMAVSLLLGEGTVFVILRPLIDSDEQIFIDAVVFRDAFWIAAISYIAKLCWDISKDSLVGYSVFPMEQRNRKIISRFNKFKWEFGAEINVILRDNYTFPAKNPEKNSNVCCIR